MENYIRKGRYAHRDGSLPLEVVSNLRISRDTYERIYVALRPREGLSDFLRSACEIVLEMTENDREFIFDYPTPHHDDAVFVNARLVAGTMDCIRSSLTGRRSVAAFLRGACEVALHYRERGEMPQRALASEASAIPVGKLARFISAI